MDIRSLHQLAADWYEAHDLVDEAINHLRDANNLEGTARLIKTHGAASLQPGQLQLLQRWLGTLPESTLKNDAALASLQAWIYYFEQRSDKALAWVEHLQNAYEKAKESTQEVSTPSVATLLGMQSWVAAQQGDFSRAERLALEALDELPQGDQIWRGKLQVLLAEALAGQGKTTEAIASYETAFRSDFAGTNLISTTAITAGIWMTKMLRGKLSEAQTRI